MKDKNERWYKAHIKAVKERYGFLPEDYEETVRCFIEALEECEFI